MGNMKNVVCARPLPFINKSTFCNLHVLKFKTNGFLQLKNFTVVLYLGVERINFLGVKFSTEHNFRENNLVRGLDQRLQKKKYEALRQVHMLQKLKLNIKRVREKYNIDIQILEILLLLVVE